MGDTEGGSEQDDVSFLRTEDMVCLVTGATGERVGLAAEGFGNRHCFLENIADKNNPPDLTQCVFVIEQALSVRALQELVTAAASESGNESVGKGTGSGHRTLLYGNAILLRHQNSNMYLACLSTTSGNDKLAFDVGLQEHSQGEACWWTVHPASKQRSEGEKVRVGDDLILVSVATERYLQSVREGDQMIVNASFHVTHWSVQPFGTGLSRLKFVGCVFGGEVLRFFHGGDECLTIPPTWTEQPEQNIVVYEGGDVVSQARSLWRLELARTKWAGGFINWMHPLRIRHITSGRYLGVNETNDLILVHRNDASLASTAFYLREEKDDQRAQLEDKDLEIIGSPFIKYGDTTVIVQHMETGLWLSYRAYETKKKGVGKVEEKQAILHEEGKMDDGLEFSRSQEEESRTGRVIRKCSSLFTRFIKALEVLQTNRSRDQFFGAVDLNEMIMCLEDLINYFAQPEDEMEHEERQNRLRALRNRQDLFQEEGILNLTLEAIDNINTITERGYLVTLASDASQNFEMITGYLYQLLAAIIKGNHTNCAQFANVNRLNWLFSRLGSQASGEGSGMLDVLHCVLIDSPEALNMMREEHIKVIISLLEKHGRDPKVLDVLCSLCVGNGVAVRSSQNNISDYLLPGKNLLLHTQLVDHVGSVRPNIFVGKVDGSAMYQKWYYEVTLDHIEQASHMMPHMRIGWANTIGYCPYPGGGEKWGGNGVGDDLYSYGFDGVSLWTGGRCTCVVPGSQEPFIRKGDVIGVALDLTVPSITFYFNGIKIRGAFKNFNVDGMFHPVVSMSSKVSCRFLFGGDQGRLRYPPPELHSPIVECLQPNQVLQIDPCFFFGDVNKTTLAGPLKIEDDTAFVPKPVDTETILLPSYVEQVRDKLAENIHEMWAMNKIEAGWMYGDYRDDYEKYHPCLVPFDRLPGAERRYDIQLAENTLKTIMALGYHISLDKPPSRIRSIRLPNDPFLQPNGYKPAPLDLSAITLTPKLEELIDQLAENTHNIWSKERIMEGWTYGLNEDPDVQRSPHLVPYSKVDEAIKVANWDTASETVRTLLVYGYVLEAPTGEAQEVQSGEAEEKRYSDFRTYRAEKTYAVSSGKWYYEFEVMTAGLMRVGWARVDCKPGNQIGSDEYAWAFDGYNSEKVHHGSSEPYGRVPHIGDIVGCMIDVENKSMIMGAGESYGKQWKEGDMVGVLLDLIDRTISFSLNGELLMDSLGGETAFTDVQGEGFVPACTLGIGQRARFSFGHDVNALRFFTTCGLQEGYEPFCVNMNRPMTFWYTKDQPIFENIDEGEDSSIDVIRIPAGSETPPSLRLSHKTFETMEKANWEFLRLSLPVICLDEFIDEDEKNRRWQDIRVRQHRLRVTGQYIRTNNLEQTIQKAGFTMSDIKELQRGYSEDDPLGDPDPGMKESDYGHGELSRGELLAPGDDGKKKERGKSPFRTPSIQYGKPMINTLKSMNSLQEITVVGKEYANRFFSRKKEGKDRTPDPEDKSGTRGTNVRLTESTMKIVPPAVPDRARKGAGAEAAIPRDEPPEGDVYDAECLDLINEYFFGVRIFPGQDPSHVYVGWVTCQYHFHSHSFTNEKVRHCTIAGIDEYDTEVENVERSSCYMVRADELYNQVTQDSAGKGASQGMFIGCTVDTATGLINFYCEGKPTKYIYKMEPNTKLFPAVFVEATSKEMLQFELGRTSTTLPLSSAVLLNSGKHLQPQFPPRLKVQYLRPHQWARVPNLNLKIHALKLSELRGWSTLCDDPVPMLALHIPEEDRCIDILELIEMEKLLSFHYHTLTLYAALCYQSNFRAAHSLCSYVDQKQLSYAIQAEYLSGPLRRGFYDVLIALHLESFSTTMEVCKNEFIIPVTPELKEFYEDEAMRHSIRSVTTISITPVMKMTDIDSVVEDMKDLSSPYFPLEDVRDFAMTAIGEAVRLEQVHNRDPIGGSNENLFVPLLKLLDKLFMVGIINDEDLDRLLVMIDPQTWDPDKEKSELFVFSRFPTEAEDEEDHRKGLLYMELAEGCKLQLCYLLHHLNDLQLRHRVESIVAFSHDYVGDVQADQLRRYVEIKQSDLPSAVAAKKTREFRCPPIEQMKIILGFKNLEEIDEDNRPCSEELIGQLREYHDGFVEKLSLDVLQNAEDGGEEGEAGGKLGMITKVIDMLNIVKKLEPPAPPVEEDPPRELLPEEKFRKVLTKTIVRWAEETHFESPVLIKEMFGLLLRQYDAFGEVIKALQKTYVFSSATINHIHAMWRGLSRIRALLPVQMSQEEEALMRFLLWDLVNNHIFFQHPDLIRILRVHENVMALMMNTLGRAQTQSDAQGAPSGGAEGGEQPAKEKDTSHEMVVACCRFLCFFCRTSRQNQKAMFEHLGFLMENSNILLSRPSLRGSTPLDVAYSSLMENTELALALREHLLEKVAVYLSRTGLQSNGELLEKGYPDLGWDPVEGERYLDFLRFCVWVGGESVEENANLVIRLLIRKPECLGPALRGEGDGLLRAIIDANKFSDRIALRNDGFMDNELNHPMPESEEDEDYIDTGAAILAFYCTLVDLLGRCAPDASVIAQGKNESLRARAILRSLVPLEDLVGALSLRFTLQPLQRPGDPPKRDVPPGLVPNHKQSIVRFLERVYGIEERDLFMRLLEDAFLPDLRAATMLDKHEGGDSEMGLALNRYIGNSILPVLIKHSRFYGDADNYASLLDAALHTVYRLSKNKMLTKGQREAVSDFLVALTRELYPNMLLKLLRKLTVDVSKLSEYTTVALRLLTLHYERCSKYYGAGGQGAYGSASEEEKRLTMMLFSNIFESLSQMEYDPDLFSKALPCLSAIGCALPPDYSLSAALDSDLFRSYANESEGPYNPMPIDTNFVQINADMNNLIVKFSEHWHDAWARRKLNNGWKYGEPYNWHERIHPRLRPYNKLTEYEKERYKESIRDGIKALLALNWTIEQGDIDMASRSAARRSSKADLSAPDTQTPFNYHPTPVDMSNMTLNREMQNMAERIAENLHDIWARKKRDDIETNGGPPHALVVPYDLLTDKEKRKDRDRMNELLKYIQYQGYRLYRLKVQGEDEEDLTRAAAQSLERRFAYSLLEKLLHYLDVSSVNLKSQAPSANYSRRSTFKDTTRDVKFFTKVVLPLMEKYFNTNRNYFIAIATGGTTSGAASLKEKEMVASLFCRLTSLLRVKLNAFGSDIKMTVRCLQVLIKAFDAKSITKSCPEFIRTSMLTFFNNAADDLAHAIINLQEKKYSHLRGTHLMTSTSLNYINSVLLPVLTSLFDHLAAYDYGGDLIVDDLQVASYKMLSSLYQLGTDMTLHKNKKYMRIELERYRPAIGSCLGAFASTFPIAFLEPSLNKNNLHSVFHKLFEQSPQTAQDFMSRLATNIPGLDGIIQEVENFVDAGRTYNEQPHIIDITLPMLCSYLPFWWSLGPDNAPNTASEAHVSNVTSEHMNKLLKSVLNLIKTNIGNELAMWMTRIAQFTQQIIINSSDELLTDPILPLAEKLRKKTELMFHKEESVRGFLKSGTDDSSQIESQIQDEWHLLVRDIYAFYPLLIKYVDYQRNNWLKNNTLEAEHLYNHIAEIFNIWSKSQYFRREETNFISANEIDNMALIMPTSTRRAVVADTSMQSGGKIKKKKKSRDKKRDKDKELASSLLVACLKRLLPVGLNLFAGREQELVQHCKDRFLKKMQDYEIVEYATTQLTLPDKIDPSDAMSWQHHLYSKLGSKREPSPDEHIDKAVSNINKEQQLQELVDRIVAMAKVLYGLHMAAFPQNPRSGWRRLLTAARKRAALACLLSIPYFTLKRHRAINLFIRTYRDMWLADENAGQEVMIEHLTQTFEEAELTKKEEEEEADKPDPLTQLVTTFTRGAMTERSGALQEDPLYMSYAEVMAKSCGEEEEEGGEEEEGEGPSIHEQEMEKQKLLFHQARLANRGVAEMVLLHIAACKGVQSDMVMNTLGLGIAILRGGNIDVQMQMLNHLKEKKDAGFFTSIAGLMNSCTVLDLDAFERNTKAEGLGVGSEGAAGEKNMHDAEFTCALFRFIQLTCEGHNLDWQNYLRTQAGNTTTVNVVICTVDYLLRLQESIMDFYWHYSSKEIIDPAGKSNFFKAIGVASQVFNTLTEVIQGPCTQNQQALAHSRLWDAIGGFLFLFAHMQAKLSKNSSQVDLLKEMLNLQKDMVIMMLSMLEGNVVNGTIGKQMVDTLVESASNVEIILRYFDMFLKLKDLTCSSTFQDMDQNKDGYVSPKEFKETLEASKSYSAEEINFLLMCCDTNHDGKIDYVEFTERFHNPAKEIGFNLAVLLTNLSEHMPNEPRLARFLETAGSVLNYFEPFLGRIEIMGSSKRIERVYFEIDESNIEQWEKPQIKESKRAFFYSIVTEGGDKEKLQAFVDFCEDAIFEMQHASALMASDDEGGGTHARDQAFVMPTDEDEEKSLTWKERGTLVKQVVTACKDGVRNFLSSLSPANIKRRVRELQQMTPVELVFGFLKLLFWVFYASGGSFGKMLKYLGSSLINLMRGPPPEKKEEDKPADDFGGSLKVPALPASAGPPDEAPAESSGVLAIMGPTEPAAEERAVEAVVAVAAPAEVSAEEGERAVVVRAVSPVRVAPEEKAPEAPAAAVSPLDVVEAHDEPSVASQTGVKTNVCDLPKTPINSKIDLTEKTDTAKNGCKADKPQGVTLEECRLEKKEEVKITNAPDIQKENEAMLARVTEVKSGDAPDIQKDKIIKHDHKEDGHKTQNDECKVQKDQKSEDLVVVKDAKCDVRLVPTITIDEAPTINPEEEEEPHKSDENIPEQSIHQEEQTSGSTSTESGSPIDELKSFIHNILPQTGSGNAEPTPAGEGLSDQQLGLAKLLDGTPLSRRGSCVDQHDGDDSDERERGNMASNVAGSTDRQDGDKPEYKDANTEKYAINIATDPSLIASRARMAEKNKDASNAQVSSAAAERKESGDGGDEKRSSSASYSSPKNKKEKKIMNPYIYTIWGIEIDFGSYFNGMVSFLARNFYNMKIVALVLAFSINFMLLFFKATALVEEDDGDGDDEIEASGYEGSGLMESGSGSGNGTLDDEEEEEEEEDIPELVHMDEKFFYMAHLMRMLSVIHSIISMALLFAYYHLKIPLAIFKREKEIARRLEFDGLYLAEQPEDDDLKAHWDRLVISAKSFPVNYWDKFVKKKVRQKYSETFDFDQISNLLGMEKTSFSVEEKAEGGGIISYLSGADWRYQIWKAGVTLTDNAFLYSLWYFCFSIMGNLNYFFFAAHLLDVAVAVPALKTILQSVTHNGKQLVLTVMLLSIVVYIYTVIAFNFFRKFYVSEEDDEVAQKCHDMATCFVFHLYQGVRAGGGIGDVIEPPDGEDSEVYRIFFDITFFFFVIVILLAIIQGLIIDAFGELRDQLNSVSETLESECFICGIGKDYFDVVPHGFDVHVLKEHNLANYMFFLMHLINKPDTEYTGQETYVWNMYQQRSWDFFPVGDCFRKQYEEELSGKSGGE